MKAVACAILVLAWAIGDTARMYGARLHDPAAMNYPVQGWFTFGFFASLVATIYFLTQK